MTSFAEVLPLNASAYGRIVSTGPRRPNGITGQPGRTERESPCRAGGRRADAARCPEFAQFVADQYGIDVTTFLAMSPAGRLALDHATLT